MTEHSQTEQTDASQIPAIADEIRAATRANNDNNIESKKAKYICSQLEAMDADTEMRFEFYVRSHFQRNTGTYALSLSLSFSFSLVCMPY